MSNFCMFVFVAALIFGAPASVIWLIVRLVSKKDTKKPMISMVLCMVVAIIFSFFIPHSEDSDPEESEEVQSETDETTDETEADETAIKYNELIADIDDFEYEISGKKIVISKYRKKKKLLIIEPTYEIDGTTYKTDLSEFMLGNSKVEFLILENGIKKIEDAVFNSSDVKYIYFPETMKVVYDKTLAYIHVDDGEKACVYYGGTKKEWKNIFTEYERQTVEEAWDSSDDAEEKGAAVGESLADKLNSWLGQEYNESDFKYKYSVSKKDIKEIAIEFSE